jgi:hypothetical protein
MQLSNSRKKTKKDRAIEIYEKSHSLPDEEIVKVFVTELNLPSENSARTYISMSKKALASKLNLGYKSRKIDQRKTKRGRAMEMFNKNPQLTRQEIIDLFKEKLEMSPASAAQHCSICAQEYHGVKHKAIL